MSAKYKWYEFEQRCLPVCAADHGSSGTIKRAKIRDERDRANRLWQAMVVAMQALITNPNQSKDESWLQDQEATARCAKQCAEALLLEWEKG